MDKSLNPSEEAQQETTSPQRLGELALLSDTLAQIVAENIATPPELLSQLGSHSSEAVKKAVVSNPNTPTQTLFELGAYFPQELLENPVFNLLTLENCNFVKDIPLKTLNISLLKDLGMELLAS
ncbi:MAG: hypothetical protein QNJ70_06930 [Xenococcaceae cyanobacterium MO_207.B15]|nr:hypothetical protein [Xenococcaceae cyanobacterium MO_207.B15]